VRILVTGATGNLGFPLVQRLLDGTGHRIRLFGRTKPACPLNDRVSWAAGDIRKKDHVAAAVEGIDIILHLAGLTHSNRPPNYDAVNVAGTINTVEAAQEAGVQRIVFFSSYVASMEGGAYARSKFLAEKAVHQARIDWIILRVADVYGPGQGGGVATLIDWVRTKRGVPIIGHGRYRLSPLYVEDLTPAVLRVLERPGPVRKVYTLAGPESITLNDLVRRTASFYGTRPLRLHLPLALFHAAALAASAVGLNTPARDQVARLRVDRQADVTDAKNDLAFNPRCLEDGLATLEQRRRSE
jgi:NADH dehydrogenase